MWEWRCRSILSASLNQMKEIRIIYPSCFTLEGGAILHVVLRPGLEAGGTMKMSNPRL
jgi:hypothetical protein